MSKFKNNARISQGHSLSSCTSSSLSSDEEEIDARDLKPIKDYLSNRKELARQLFKSVKQEKIRMMLPQVLKQMDLSELEEWCVTELNGMSKARILSILNGKTMLESSDTSESDDSGPSLEIISDTEEWLTDDDMSTKENGGKGKMKRDKTKVIGKAQINKKNDIDKSNIKPKCNIKSENVDKTKDVKIKKEDDKDKAKEGDSLLDLLELEMRARAIRALIRKEEDIIPSINSSQTNNQIIENNIETSQDVDKAKENCRKQLERIISGQQSNKGEDEDVVLVIQPTPVVELLSSDSDQETLEKTHVNKKLKSIHSTESGKSTNNSDESTKNSKTCLQDSKERRGTQEVTGIHSVTNIVTKTELSEARVIMSERNVDIKNNILSISISADNVAEKRKKSKKKSHTKSQPASSTSENYSKSEQINIEIIEQSSDMKNTEESTNPSDENEVTMEEVNKTKEKIAKEDEIEEEDAADLDEIIDLDDYCDVVIGNCDEDKSQDKIIVPSQQEHNQPTSQTTLPKLDSTETWASRYYQTDDVQNVIKESKIQSDIRKRLRERQRLSKLNKTLNLNSSSQSSATDATVTSENTPTGSVEEYLALKRATAASIDTNNSNNDTTQDNPAIINSNNDITTKELSVQDESISSHQKSKESTDNDVQKVIVPEIVDVESAVVTDTKNDTQPG